MTPTYIITEGNKMNVQKPGFIYSGIFIVVVGLGAACAAQAADDGWYLGAGVGRSNGGLSGIDTTLAGYGVTSASTAGDTATAWKVLGGYQINKYFGVEGAYAKPGQYSISSTVSAPGAGLGTATWEASNVWSLAALGYAPIQDHFSAFAKIGVAYSKVNFNYSDTVGDVVSASKNTTSPLFGVGLKFDFNERASLRGEFERYQNLGDSTITGQSSLNVWSLGMQYRF
jgi:OmpA-OmpF porin, OOP family